MWWEVEHRCTFREGHELALVQKESSEPTQSLGLQTRDAAIPHCRRVRSIVCDAFVQIKLKSNSVHIHVCLTVNGMSLGVEDHGDALCRVGRKAPEEPRPQLPPARRSGGWERVSFGFMTHLAVSASDSSIAQAL